MTFQASAGVLALPAVLQSLVLFHLSPAPVGNLPVALLPKKTWKIIEMPKA